MPVHASFKFGDQAKLPSEQNGFRFRSMGRANCQEVKLSFHQLLVYIRLGTETHHWGLDAKGWDSGLGSLPNYHAILDRPLKLSGS